MGAGFSMTRLRLAAHPITMNKPTTTHTPTPDRICALDYECYYDNDVSIVHLGPAGYFGHPQADIYMVSAVFNDGTPTFVGHPSEFDWDLLKDAIVLSHNASFDQFLYHFGVEKNWWPGIDYKAWHCTADLAAYLGGPRSLKGSMKHFFDVDLSKDTRDNMKGKRWKDMTPEFRAEVTAYAHKDSEYCLRLWEELSDGWPEAEREVSSMNRQLLMRGLPIDEHALDKAIASLSLQLHEMESVIPWTKEGKKLLSREAFNEQCRAVGIEPPKSLAKDNAKAVQFFKDHASQHAWINATMNWRRVNTLYKKMKAMQASTTSRSRYYGGIKYFGAQITGRFSGAGGNLNLQNLPRDEMFGVNVRSLIKAKPGNVLIPVDLNQIEVRTLLWLAGDYKMLNQIELAEAEGSAEIYEVFATRFGIWKEGQKGFKKAADTRMAAKAMTLGCGYQCGPGGLMVSPFFNGTEEEALQCVGTYRRTMPDVVELWETYQREMVSCHIAQRPLKITLPTGRAMNYGVPFKHINPRTQQVGYACKVYRGGDKPMVVSIYGGKLTENASQALARDIFVDRLLKMREERDLPMVLHVHDEVVAEVPESEAEETLKYMETTMSTAPEWIPDIPLAAEGGIVSEYAKV